MNASDVREALEFYADEARACMLQRFFKTGPGEYAEGDLFLGLRVPQVRSVVKESLKVDPVLPLHEVEQLLLDPFHEVRLAGFLFLVEQYVKLLKRKDAAGAQALIDFYLAHAHLGNNWDLVDCVCPKLLGEWLCHDDIPMTHRLEVMDTLAHSDNLWRQRISMVSTWTTVRRGLPQFTQRYALMHLHHPHPLMHKAVGWMLRELGKHGYMHLLEEFLEQHAHGMPRTALRYAIEKMSEDERKYWMGK